MVSASVFGLRPDVFLAKYSGEKVTFGLSVVLHKRILYYFATYLRSIFSLSPTKIYRTYRIETRPAARGRNIYLQSVCSLRKSDFYNESRQASLGRNHFWRSIFIFIHLWLLEICLPFSITYASYVIWTSRAHYLVRQI